MQKQDLFDLDIQVKSVSLVRPDLHKPNMTQWCITFVGRCSLSC
ncbi:hypothetical protein BFO01nite_32070 [Brevibacillus formosus]|uniref:Lantibiotic n=1 Tax=Brevibacillus formosus TaxID=54913 RepID=A0ABQ0T6X2_9BACL|nr:hypothetical protein BFO01nite_32070 [Brevibacillus formosus]